MKTPWYETSVGALDQLLLSGNFVWADLYTITTVNGPTLYYTTADIDVAIPAFTWAHNLVRVDNEENKSTAHWKIGLDVDTWTVFANPRLKDPVTGAAYPDKIGDEPWLAAVTAGALDAADVQVDRAYFPSWPSPMAMQANPTAILTIFAGRMAEIDYDRGGALLNINSYTDLLNISMPIDLYQANCRYGLFDAGCKLLAADFAQSGTVLAGSSQGVILSSLAAPGGSGTYALGRIVMTSGRNAGFARTVRRWTLGTFSLITPLPYGIAPGDTFTAYPGCDKTQLTCQAFSNSLNFGGQPYIPVPETAY